MAEPIKQTYVVCPVGEDGNEYLLPAHIIEGDSPEQVVNVMAAKDRKLFHGNADDEYDVYTMGARRKLTLVGTFKVTEVLVDMEAQVKQEVIEEKAKKAAEEKAKGCSHEAAVVALLVEAGVSDPSDLAKKILGAVGHKHE